MATEIEIEAGGVTLSATLNNSSTAKALADAMPIEAAANLWGDEIYFSTAVSHPLEEDAVEIVEVGDLAYWPSGKGFCIFFGPTPMSQGEEIRPASAVNLVGSVDGDATLLKQVEHGAAVTVRVR